MINLKLSLKKTSQKFFFFQKSDNLEFCLVKKKFNAKDASKSQDAQAITW